MIFEYLSNRFSGLRAVLSGPAGGVVGIAKTAYEEQTGTPVIGFDMGEFFTQHFHCEVLIFSPGGTSTELVWTLLCIP